MRADIIELANLFYWLLKQKIARQEHVNSLYNRLTQACHGGILARNIMIILFLHTDNNSTTTRTRMIAGRWCAGEASQSKRWEKGSA